MGDAADDDTDAGLDALALHADGRCGELGGPCPYCEPDDDDCGGIDPYDLGGEG